jgi:hypothetical protein
MEKGHAERPTALCDTLNMQLVENATLGDQDLDRANSPWPQWQPIAKRKANSLGAASGRAAAADAAAGPTDRDVTTTRPVSWRA